MAAMDAGDPKAFGTFVRVWDVKANPVVVELAYKTMYTKMYKAST
jgi:hypothetical protein